MTGLGIPNEVMAVTAGIRAALYVAVGERRPAVNDGNIIVRTLCAACSQCVCVYRQAHGTENLPPLI